MASGAELVTTKMSPCIVYGRNDDNKEISSFSFYGEIMSPTNAHMVYGKIVYNKELSPFTVYSRNNNNNKISSSTIRGKKL